MTNPYQSIDPGGSRIDLGELAISRVASRRSELASETFFSPRTRLFEEKSEKVAEHGRMGWAEHSYEL